MFTLSHFHKPQFWLTIFKGKVGGKYLKRWQVTDPRTGKNKWVYKYKPISQRGAHEITKDRFRKVTKIADETHRAAVEKALQDGHSISMRILKDYPDLVQKYNKTAKVRNFDRISAKVKEAKQKIESAKDQFSAKENDLIERSLNLYNSKNKNEQAKLKKQLEDGIQSGNGSDSDARAGKELIRRINEQEARSIPKKEIPKPAFKLEAESLPVDQRERNATQDLFPKKPTDKIVNQNYKPKASLKETTPQGLTTEIKDILLKEGMDSKAREFTDRAMRAKDSSEIMKIASEYVNIPKDASAKPSYNTELDKARKEKDPKTKWRNLKAILDKAKSENNVPEGLEQEVKEAGKAMLNHALSGEWESKSPKKEINIDSMNPKRTK